jgi:hypothetical protein
MPLTMEHLVILNVLLMILISGVLITKVTYGDIKKVKSNKSSDFLVPLQNQE